MAVFDISLADLSPGLSGIIATEMVLLWNSRPKSAERHVRMMQPYRSRGTMVSTDAAGLSTLTQRYSLPQVMKLISEPKEVIHALGKAIGGEAIGVWAADNSQMFYPDSIAPARVVAQMREVQRRLKALTVQVGMCIHQVECYRIAGGLFGRDVDMVEEVAEERSHGGEIVVSAPVLAQLAEPLRRTARRREDLQSYGELWSLGDDGEPLVITEGRDINYPTPFDAAFFATLRATSLSELEHTSFRDYLLTPTVAFVRVAHRRHEYLLDAFTDMSLIDLAFRRIASSYKGDVVKSNGILAIVLFEHSEAALTFSRDIIETTRTLGLDAHVGLTRGEVFLFPLAGGGRDIAGNPINIASKLAEDSGLGGILVESSVLTDPLAARLAADAEPFCLTISRVALTGYRVPV